MKKLQKSFESHWKGQKPWGNDWSFLWKKAKTSVRYQRLAAQGKSQKEIEEIFKTPTRLSIYTHNGLESATMSPLDSVAYHQMILHTGFLAMDAENGHVLAYVGGIDFGHFPYDHIYSRRQVGSTFKPFVYATALEAGISPCDFIENEPIIFSNYEDWSPQNADGKYGGFYTVKGGLANSVNTVAARLVAETGPGSVADMARRLGIRSKLPEVPALALGVADISLEEMVSAYSAFSNTGEKVEPVYILKIETSEGGMIYEAEKPKPEEVLKKETAQTMRSMLELVVDSGTARSLRSVYGLSIDVGGKTGTTQDNADGWFMAITPNLICGAWVGGDSPIIRFRSTRLGQGAATALPIVGEFLKRSSNNKQIAKKVGVRFPQAEASARLDLLCPIYVENRTENFFDQLFDKEAREKKRELKKEARKEEKEKEKKGWMGRLLDKLSGKRK